MDTLTKKISKNIEENLLINFVNEKENDLSIVNEVFEETKSSNFIDLILQECLQESINNSIQEGIQNSDSWFSLGVSCLINFLKHNWTGPRNLDEDNQFEAIRQKALISLSSYSDCNENLIKPELLYISKEIFSNNYIQSTYDSSTWWLFRINLLHQFIMEEYSSNLYEETSRLIPVINQKYFLKDLYCKTLFSLEVAQFYILYGRVQTSENFLQIAEKICKLTFNLEGAMGKRTKYQQEDKAQLYLKVKVDKEVFPYKICEDLPKSVDLEDELRLERIEFSEPKEKVQLGSLEEAVILTKFMHIKQSQPKHQISEEEIKPYLMQILDTKAWSLKVSALKHRCCLESSHKRTIERSMMQAENLLQEIHNCKVPVHRRIDLIFASGLQPIWVLEEMLASLMLNLGLIKAALDAYLKLRLWEEVIVCYNILELKHKAAEIIQQEISKKPTVKLWCLLGDAEQNIDHYETAWKLSEKKSSKVQRHWGNHYFLKKEYEAAIPHFQLSVELNYIQENVWLRLGFSALQTKDWKLAAAAYRTYCSLEYNTFEAWNNLGKAYIMLGDKQRAYMAIQEAIRCNYDRWEIWDNMMVVCVDLGHFSEVIGCYHRVLDFKNQHVDVQVLKILADAIRDNIEDFTGNSCLRLLPKALELFGRISASVQNNSDVWKLYAQLTLLKKTEIDDQIAVQYLQHGYKAAISNSRWFQRPETTLEVLQLCINLATITLQCFIGCSEQKKRALLGSVKLSLQNTLTKVKDQMWQEENISSQCHLLEEYLNSIVSELEKIKISG
ncbi:tetratricopeptide repeat protein 27 [Prorops nasuta]|uniref:tetratricopeptide repeat protein 27 n=1 Tax=Prorops nasuta TaxID=863751 RepID=UPI0034CDE96D